MSDIKQILTNAKLVLQTRGSTIGSFVADEGGPVCLLGAVGIAVDPEFERTALNGGGWDHFFEGGEAYTAVEALYDELPEHQQRAGGPYGIGKHEFVYGFNDARDCSMHEDQEVYDLIDRAIDAA